MRASVVDTKRSTSSHVAQEVYPKHSKQHLMPDDRPSSYSVKRARPVQKSRSLILAPAEGWLSLVLLAIALYCVVIAVVSAGWVAHSPVLLWSPALGLLVGLFVAKTPRLPQGIMHVAACLVGHWFSVWLTCVVAFHISWTVLLSNLRAVVLGGLSPSLIPNTDLIFFFYLSFLCFFLGYFGCWLVYRAHLPWLVTLVYCSIMLVNLNGYARQDVSYLVIVMLGALLLLIARVHLTHQVQLWTKEGLHTDSTWLRSITWRCMQIALLLTALVLMLTSISPTIAQPTSGKVLWDSLDNAWTNIVNGRVSLQAPGSLLQPYQPQTNFFGDQLTISGSVRLPSGEVLFYNGSGARYLQGFTFNIFDGHTWSSSTTIANGEAYDSNAPLPLDVAVNQPTTVTTDVTLVRPPEGTKHYLFAPAQPSAFTVPTMIYSDGTASAWAQQGATQAGEQYQVISTLPVSDVQALSAVPLPSNGRALWQSDRNINVLFASYMQTPRDLSPKVLETMKQWTAGATNTYTALQMLEGHLSDQNVFTYSISNPPIPANIDVVDWLLQTRAGYCTYYTSAMAIMARQLGIPTRVVNGFSQGHFDKSRNVWVVNGADAHSWVQAYFPNYGWINFDPTPGFALNSATHSPTPSPTVTPPTKQPTKGPTTQPTPPPGKQPTPPPAKTQKPTGRVPTHFILDQGMLEWFTALVLLCSLLFFFYAAGTFWWRRVFSGLKPVAGLFKRLCLVASLAGLRPRPSQTPTEYSLLLSRHVPQAANQIRDLTQLFECEQWGGPSHVPDVGQAAYAQQLWLRLRRLFLKLVLTRSRA